MAGQPPRRPGEYTIFDAQAERPDGQMPAVERLLLALGGIPLSTYLFVVIANLKNLAGRATGKESHRAVATIHILIVSSLAYPLIFAVDFVLAKFTARRRLQALSLAIAVVPIRYNFSFAYFLWAGGHIRPKCQNIATITWDGVGCNVAFITQRCRSSRDMMSRDALSSPSDSLHNLLY